MMESYSCLLKDSTIFRLPLIPPTQWPILSYDGSLDHPPSAGPPSQSPLLIQKPLMDGAKCLINPQGDCSTSDILGPLLSLNIIICAFTVKNLKFSK